jgi:flagellar M-ring protein FliF
MNRMSQVVDRAKSILAGFTTGQRAIVVVAVLALVLGAATLTRWAAQPAWAPLFTNLSAKDASAIVDQLRTDNVQYQLTNGGTTVMVPQAQVYDLRVAMAGKGLADGSDSNGYSVLDSQGMTATDLQQNIAYQRALEAELNRTLQAITGVSTAIVHIAIPKKDVFSTETDHPTASVLLALKAGTALGRAQIRSVMHLVAGSVPGLDPSDVTVTDADGNMLSVREDGQVGAVGMASEADRQTQAFEDAKSDAVQKMLDQVLGKGRSVVRVNAELDFASSDTTSKTYVVQSTLPPLSEATSSESYAAANGAGGALGQSWPSLTPAVGANGGGTYVKIEKTVDNAVGEVINRTQAAPGTVKRLTVAVMLDSRKAAQVDPAQLQTLVENAVGFDQKRGDSVRVDRLAFDTAATETAAKELAQAQSAARTAQYLDLGKKAGLGLLLVLGALLLRRRTRGEPLAKVEAVATDLPHHQALLSSSLDGQLAISAEAHEKLQQEASEADALDKSLERELLRDEVTRFVDQQPEEIAAIVQGWLSQRKN